MSINLRTVLLVAAKELRESLRDKRTLFVALVLPVLLYPLMTLAVAPLLSMQRQKLKAEFQRVAVTGAPKLFEVASQLTWADGKVLGAPEGLMAVPSEDPAAELAAGSIALWVEVEVTEGAAFGESFLLTGTEAMRLIVHRDGSNDTSLTAERKFNEWLATLREYVLEERREHADLPPGWHRPVETTSADVASPERRAAYLFGKMLAFVLVVLTLSSSFYPAVDSVAGEKERGTMETLLVAPCGRSELVLGKFVAVLAVTLAAAILNLVSMGLTLGPLMAAVASDVTTGLRVTPTVLVGILALLVPLGALFSAVSLALSTLARSAKEGQHYLSPLFFVVMPLAMVVILPNVPLTNALAPVPVTNAVLFFRDLLLGKTEPGTTAIVMISTFAYAAAALWGCVTLFLREETLFRGPEGSTRLLTRPAPRETPGGAAALFLFMACMALIWYGQSLLPKGIVVNVLATQLIVILIPCVLLTMWLRARPATTFQFRRPPALSLVAALLLGLAMPVLNIALHSFFGSDVTEVPQGPLKELGEEIEKFVREHAFLAVLLIAVLPAVCEELFFRGFVLSGLRSTFRGTGAATRAVLLTSALFAIFHVLPERWLPTFAIAIVLGFCAVRTRSIWPGMLAHAVNNGFALFAVNMSPALIRDEKPTPLAVIAAALCFAGGLALLVLTIRRSRAES